MTEIKQPNTDFSRLKILPVVTMLFTLKNSKTQKIFFAADEHKYTQKNRYLCSSSFICGAIKSKLILGILN
jgi:hypothetical protein